MLKQKENKNYRDAFILWLTDFWIAFHCAFSDEIHADIC